METKKNRTLATAILIVILSVSTLAAFSPSANAHDPAQNIKTYALLSVGPSTVGVGQDVIVYMWLSMQPPTASGAYGDRWHDFSLTITKPDMSTEVQGPFTSDPIGFAWTLYTPTQTGQYTFQFSFPGQTLAGDNLNPTDPTGQDFIGDYFEPSTSETVSITVQQEALAERPETPLPTYFWTRPINPQNREWDSISGNWLENPNNFPANFYSQGPETSHILWTKELTIGGLVGGSFGDTSYHCGNAYEGKWTPPVIINGMLYYNNYATDTYYGRQSADYLRAAPQPGVTCVDLRTGEEVWYNNDTRIDFGQIYRYDSPNQHGAFAYLWSMSGTTWKAYDAFTGNYVYTITNVPAGTQVFGTDGSIQRYVFDAKTHTLALWNANAIPQLLGGATGTENWQWRPYGKVVDGKTGYVWNKTVSADIAGAINYVFVNNMILGSSGLGRTNMWLNLGTTDFSVWALNLASGSEGQLLWKKDYTSPAAGVTLNMEAASTESMVFTLWAPESRQHWGYSLADGAQIWGPTDPQDSWDFTVGTTGTIAYGKLLTFGYSGIVYCYDVTSGTLDWTWEAADEYYGDAHWTGRYVLDVAFIADGKVYAVAGEHSPDDPKERGSPMACIDIASGEQLWRIPFYSGHWANNPAIADGIIAYLNSYDQQIYAIGKGPSATTVEAPLTGVPKGTSIMITGTVTDQSAGAKDTPAISDNDMDNWMQYLYMQQQIPGNAQGVTVTITATDTSGHTETIGTVTSDMSGMFKKMWTPTTEGEYTITATFGGSKAYYASYAETAVGVVAASGQSSTTGGTQETSTTGITTVDMIIIVVVLLAVIIGIVNVLAIRKIRK